MRVVLSGGGTAGHINPALALAEVLIERGHEVFYAGTPQGVEARLVKEAQIPFKPFEAKGFNRNHPKTIVSAVRILAKSTKLACAWFEELKPDIVVAFGGYVCIPVGRAAKKMGIPLVVHEQNSVMGMANKYLAQSARAVALTYEVAGESVSDKTKLTVTGNPVRSSVLTATREEGRSMLHIPEQASLLLVFGGSLGARHLNTAIASMKQDLLAIDDLFVVHITGPKELEAVQAALALTDEEKRRYIVMGYQNRMGETMAACDMVISRAGATSLAEISARCIPAILIPFPFATADHQTTNARSYVQAGAAWMMADDAVESAEFKDMVLSFVNDKEARAKMSQAAQGFETGDAATKLADVVLNAALERADV